jgi:Tfp pilus assembly protein PilE
MRTIINNKGFNLVELMMAVAFSLLLMTAVYGFYNIARQSYFSGISGQSLQDGANIVLSKIIEGKSESNVVYRLSTAVSYMIPNNSTGDLYYCQVSPCTSGDLTARRYYLNTTVDAKGAITYQVIYHHPKAGGGTIDEMIYTAPNGSILTLRFSPAAVGTPANVLEIDVALNQNLSQKANSRTISGTASTFVLIRNHP